MGEEGISIEEFLSWAEEAPEKTMLSAQILALIEARPMTCAAIAKKLGRKYATVFGCLARLVKAGQVIKRYHPETGTPLYAAKP